MKKYTIILIALAVMLPKISLADTTLGVTSIAAVKTSAIANNTYADGWKWIFDVTLPEGEDKIQMKFADWTNGSLSIPSGSNMHFYSAQSLNATSSDSAINIDSSNAYGNELILDPTKGQQVQVAVEIKVPTGVTGGSYSTSYGIQTSSSQITATTTASSTGSVNVILPPNVLDDNQVSYGSKNANLGSFSLQAQTIRSFPSILNSLKVKLSSNNGVSINTLLSNINLCFGSTCYVASSVLNDGVATFDNLNTSSFTWSEISIRASGVDGDPSVFSITSDLLSSSIVAVDSNGNALSTASSRETVGNTTFTPWLLRVDVNNRIIGANGTTLNFVISNESSDNLYLSKITPAGNIFCNMYEQTPINDYSYLLQPGRGYNCALFSTSSTAVDSVTLSYGPDSTNPTTLSRTFKMPNY
ncbi:MAG: hypothetical protein WCO09_03185 [bacterium]